LPQFTRPDHVRRIWRVCLQRSPRVPIAVIVHKIVGSCAFARAILSPCDSAGIPGAADA
jgi:hypothetical protein